MHAILEVYALGSTRGEVVVAGSDVSLWVRVHKRGVSSLFFQVLYMISIAKPCRSRLLIVSSAEGTVRSGSSQSASKFRTYFQNLGHLFLVFSNSQVGFHVALISSLSEDS